MFPIKNAVPTRYPPVVTWALIAANCIVFFVEISLSTNELEGFLADFALVPAQYFGPFADADANTLDYLPFLTNTFLHGGWLHLILNMWTLWLFGSVVEDRLGPFRYLAFYLVCGVLASVTHALFNPGSIVPALGASGAIAGVLGCYVRLFPWSRVVVVLPILFLPLFFATPAAVFVGLWFLIQLLQGVAELLTPSTSAGIAWWAHIGGFVAGVALGPVLIRPERRYRTYYGDEGILGFNASGRR
jgi:membrane associated rhomboid family serine protease